MDENLGIRIGIDYGADEQVVWGKYGYMDSQEVTATSFLLMLLLSFNKSP